MARKAARKSRCVDRNGAFSWYQIPEHVKAPKAIPPVIRNDKKI